MAGLLLDTHVWIWAQEGDSHRLKARDLRLIEEHQRAGEAYVSAISAWEIANLVRKKKITLSLALDTWLAAGTAPGRLQVLPVTVPILVDSTRLPGELHPDPADRILLASARAQGLLFMTKDDPIIAYAKQGHLNLAHS